MRMRLATLVTFIALAVSAQTPPASAPLVEFFVSAQGDDKWSGRRANPDGNDGPFATVRGRATR